MCYEQLIEFDSKVDIELASEQKSMAICNRKKF